MNIIVLLGLWMLCGILAIVMQIYYHLTNNDVTTVGDIIILIFIILPIFLILGPIVFLGYILDEFGNIIIYKRK